MMTVKKKKRIYCLGVLRVKEWTEIAAYGNPTFITQKGFPVPQVQFPLLSHS